MLRQSDDTGGDQLRSDQLPTPPAVSSAQAAHPAGPSPSAAPSAQPQAASPKAGLVSPFNPPPAAAAGGNKPQQQRQLVTDSKLRQQQQKNGKLESLEQHKQRLEKDNKGLQQDKQRLEQVNKRLVQDKKGLQQHNEGLQQVNEGLQEANERLEQHDKVLKQQNMLLMNRLAEQGKAARETSTSNSQLQALVEQMVSLAVVGACVLSFKHAEGCRTVCSYENVGRGKGGPVRKGMYLDPKYNKPVDVVVKVVDVSTAANKEQGFSIVGSQSEAVLTTVADSLRNNGGTGAAAGGGGALGGGDVRALVHCQELKWMPINDTEDQQLQEILNFEVPGREEFETELDWFEARDALAKVYLEGGVVKGKLVLVLVLPLADGGSMEAHVAKPFGGLNCSYTGALGLDTFLFLALYLAKQLSSYLGKGLFCRDIKSANILMSAGLPWLADLDMGLCKGVVEWAFSTGYYAKGFLIGTCCGTVGYAVESVALLGGLTAAKVAHCTLASLKLKGADVGALCFTLLDLLTGKIRYTLVKETTGNDLLDGANCPDCKFVPGCILSLISGTPLLAAKALPEKVIECLKKGVSNGVSDEERAACLEQLIVALEEALEQRAGKEGVSKEAFMSLQRQQLQHYLARNK